MKRLTVSGRKGRVGTALAAAAALAGRTPDKSVPGAVTQFAIAFSDEGIPCPCSA